jgi:Uma2 family endonuclease
MIRQLSTIELRHGAVSEATGRVELFGLSGGQCIAIRSALGEHASRVKSSNGAVSLPSLLYDVSWGQYQALLEAVGDRRLRHSYDRGILEVMSPRKDHDWVKVLIGRMIEELSLAAGIEIQSVGSTTLGKPLARRGLEPDESYYIANEPKVRGKKTYDPDRDPPPDLVVEVDVTSSSVPRMPLFASLGVPEVWRHDNGIVSFHRLTKTLRYAAIRRSVAFPFVEPADIAQFLDHSSSMGENALIRSFIRWARKRIADQKRQK